MLTLWRFSDCKPGHDNQSLGLAEALCRLVPCQIEVFKVSTGWPRVFSWLSKRFPEGNGKPQPDLIIGAGHATHWPMLAARRACGGRIAVLMQPSLPLSWFDWVVAPKHDSLPPSDTTFATLGPINRIQTNSAPDPGKGLMLIGGPSGEYGWSETALLKQIHLIALHQPKISWQLTTSRRTPAGFLANLARLELVNVNSVAYEDVSGDWLPAQLAQVAQVWVTPDSASMVYEALSTGAAVGCFELPYASPGRVARGLEQLLRDRRVTTFSDWEHVGKLHPNDHPLNEAERCARHLLQCLNNP